MRPIERITQKMFSDHAAYLRLVCDEMKVSALDVMSKKRDQRTTMARHLVMWALHRFTDATSTQIGNMMCRDHASVLYGIGAVEDNLRMPYADETRKIVDLLMKKGEELAS